MYNKNIILFVYVIYALYICTMTNEINTNETNTWLKDYALEDMQFAKKESKIAIAQTKLGLVELTFSLDSYEVTNGFGKSYSGLMNTEQTIDFLIKECYVVGN